MKERFFSLLQKWNQDLNLLGRDVGTFLGKKDTIGNGKEKRIPQTRI